MVATNENNTNNTAFALTVINNAWNNPCQLAVNPNTVKIASPGVVKGSTQISISINKSIAITRRKVRLILSLLDLTNKKAHNKPNNAGTKY